MEKATNLIILLFLQCVVTISILALYHIKNNTAENEIVVVDFKKIMKTGLSKIAENELSELEQKKSLNQLSTHVSDALHEIAALGNRTILIKEVVLGGARDETDQVLEKVLSHTETGSDD